MAVTVLLTADTAPEKLDELKALLAKLLVETRAYEGCLNIWIYESQKTPGRLVFYENWESIQAYEAYLGWRTEQGVMDQLGAMLIAPPKISYFDLVPI